MPVLPGVACAVKDAAIRCAVVLLPFAALAVLTELFLEDVYLYSWMYDNRYCYLWLAAALFALFDKRALAYIFSYGDLFAIILGSFISDRLHDYTVSLITEDMSNQMKVYLHLHRGFRTWLYIMLVILAVYGAYRFYHSRVWMDDYGKKKN